MGISINDHQATYPIKALDTGLEDTVQVIYNLFDQSAADDFLSYCEQHDIA